MGLSHDRVSKEGLAISRFNDFSQNLPYSPTSKFQELETGFHEIFIQSDIKSVRQILCKLRKCEIKLN